MRCCARRILDAATNCIALVIFCVLLMLATLLRISFKLAMFQISCRTFAEAVFVLQRPAPEQGAQELPALGGLELLDTSLELAFDLAIEVGRLIDLVHQRLVLGIEVGVQRRFKCASTLFTGTSVRKPSLAA
jgi:hypothetical protein